MIEHQLEGSKRAHGMKLRKPATKWQDALPSGNGTMGAMVYGSIQEETILLNHEEHWEGSVTKPLPDLSGYLPEVRRLLAEGKFKEANTFYPDRLREAGYIVQTGRFQPGFDLKLRTETQYAFRDYIRELDFETGQVSVRWKDGQIHYDRRLFVSRTDDVVALVVRADRKGAISLELELLPHDLQDATDKKGHPLDLPLSFEQTVEEDFLIATGKREKDGSEFGAVARIVSVGGSREVKEDKLVIAEADEVIILTRLFAQGESASQTQRLKEELLQLPADYNALFVGHQAEHRKLFLRTELDLDMGSGRDSVNEQLLLDAYNGDVPAALMERMFDYGRYLLLSSSRPGGLPANLQGVWNGSYAPPWSSAFFNNENIQMNYWQALPGNMPETMLPFFDFFESLVPDMRQNAQAFYGCRGILAPLFASPDSGLKKNLQPHVVYWSAGAGWLAQHFYDYWLFTGDRDFLQNRAVPFMKECAMFYEDFFFEGEDGYYISSPSNSPENWAGGHFEGALKVAVCVNATMDFAVAKEVLANLCAACNELGLEPDSVQKWERMIRKIPPYEVNEDGAIREWMHPDLQDNYHHRHQSHIYPLFPGLEVTEETQPEWFEACRVAVEKRLVIGLKEQTGWSLSHMANIYARLGDGDRALECLEISSRSCVGDNLLTYHNDWRSQGITMKAMWGHSAPYQIEANMGWTAAMLEMLVFSSPGMIKLLPALPRPWTRGRIKGVMARGEVEVAIEWDMEAAQATATLLSRRDQWITIKFPRAIRQLSCTGECRDSSYGPLYREVHAAEDQELILDMAFIS
ncbi:glycoside hydrolase N-terminal domain-containing protein [Paenibacillus sp. J2TS4]|uniref:glycoside hydrolase family 95 protein n=1 Tax=Paenibacillus sp. J2TS4 TaxID=2807194 RepID=UPI001B1B3B07|nr:glycoside hydrolase family 95 protein [Paenibacillus sp. J2TS4]GIP31464.1 hypothetical protein J2TS4_06740 [Paenibacillus sp. J2TS4]